MDIDLRLPSGEQCQEDEKANGIDNILDGDKKKLHFGEIILEILTYGRLKNVGPSIQSKLNDVLLREIYNDNEVCSTNSLQEEIKPVVDVALLCTRSRPANRRCIEASVRVEAASLFTKSPTYL